MYLRRVASRPAIWGEWISCGPLLIFIVVSLDNEPRLRNVDWMMMGSFFVCLTAGLLINFPKSIAMGTFWLVVSFATFLPTLLLPYYCHPSNVWQGAAALAEDQALVQVNSVQYTLIRRYELAWLLTIMDPIFGIIYLLALCGLITPAQTIAGYQILSVLTKGLFVIVAMVPVSVLEIASSWT